MPLPLQNFIDLEGHSIPGCDGLHPGLFTQTFGHLPRLGLDHAHNKVSQDDCFDPISPSSKIDYNGCIKQHKEKHVSLEELEAEIRKLNLKERAALARWIVQSLDELSESEIEALWADEAERRLDELEQGLATEISAEEVLRRARASIS